MKIGKIESSKVLTIKQEITHSMVKGLFDIHTNPVSQKEGLSHQLEVDMFDIACSSSDSVQRRDSVQINLMIQSSFQNLLTEI